jgi:putative inorganic carbon (hco3(-)) transporter
VTHSGDPSTSVGTTTVLPKWLAASRLFRGVDDVQSRWEHGVASAWEQSFIGGVLVWLFSRNVDDTVSREACWVLGRLPALSILGLLVMCCLYGTGTLGMATLAIAGWVAVVSLITGKNRWVKMPHLLDILVLIFFATYIISAAFSSFHQASLLGLVKQGTFFIAYCAMRSTWVHAPGAMASGFGVLMILGLWQTCLGWMQLKGYAGELAGWTDADVPAELRISRVYGSIQPYNPNLLAAFLLNCLGATGWVLLQTLLLPLRQAWPWGVVLIGLLGAIGYSVVLTGCRGAYLGMFVGIISLFMFILPILKTDAHLKTKPLLIWLWLAIAGLGLGGATLGILSSEKILARITSIFAFREDSSISYRMNVYISAWRMFLDNWLVGIGPSNTVFKKVYGYYMVPGFNALGAYSVPLEIMVEQGIVGLSAFLVLLGGLWHQSVKRLFGLPLSTAAKFSVLALGCTLLMVLTHGFFDTILYRPPIMFSTLFILSGLISHIEKPPFTP